MGKKKITLPNFKTIDEMAEFFDRTDTTLIDGFEEVDIKFVKAKQEPIINIRIRLIMRSSISRSCRIKRNKKVYFLEESK